MKKMPQPFQAISLDRIINQNISWVNTGDGYLRWVPARPVPFYYNPIISVAKRFKMAFDVFIGSADALYWDNQ